jgi:hypothetical protein
MPVATKLTKQKTSRKKIEDAHYHWECLRRSSSYSESIEVFSKLYLGWIKVQCDPPWLYKEADRRGLDGVSKERFISKAFADHRDFEKQWGIEPTDPTFGVSLRETYRQPWLNPFLIRRTLFVANYGPAIASRDPNVLVLQIDATGPVEEILAQVEYQLRQHKRQSGERGDHRRKPRKRFECFDQYLRAYDLKNAGETYKEIAEKLFSKSKADPKKANEYYSKAAMWINRAGRGEW